MRNISYVYKDGRHFFFLEVEGEMGGTTPAKVTQVAEINGRMSDAEVGSLIITCLAASKEFAKYDGWDDPKTVDKQIRKLGYKSYSDLRRGALFVYVYKDDDKLIFYPHRRRGERSPVFVGVGEIVPDSSSLTDLGKAFQKAVLLSE